jgi:predicted HD phosphohydrolase
MNDLEAKKFEKENFFDQSIKLRKFDESAKKAGLKIKSIVEYKDLLISKLS